MYVDVATILEEYGAEWVGAASYYICNMHCLHCCWPHRMQNSDMILLPEVHTIFSLFAQSHPHHHPLSFLWLQWILQIDTDISMNVFTFTHK